MEKIRWERICAILLSLALGAVALYLILRYVFPVFLPFLLAYALSLIIRPIAKKLSSVIHLPQKPIACILLLILLLGGAYLFWTISVRLFTEAGELVRQLLSDGILTDVMESVQNRLSSFSQRLGWDVWGNRENLNQTMTDLLHSALSSLASRLPDLLASLASALPAFFLLVVITLIAGFYLCMDGERITSNIVQVFPRSVQMRLSAFKRTVSDVCKRYLRAYLYLFLLTFFLLLIGLLILGVKYALLLSFLIALADLLPVIGVGSIMIPWGLILLLQKNYYIGFGLLILYLIISLVRQIAEPRIIGKSLGLHPLLALLASYAGLTLFGFWGMLFSPIAAILIKVVFLSFFPPKKEVFQKTENQDFHFS